MTGNEKLKPLKILLVENNDAEAFLIKEMLMNAPDFNFNMKICGTLEETLQTIAEESFDVILINLKLPDSSGFKPLKKIINNGNDTPLIVIAAGDDGTTGRKSLKLGAQGFIVKDEMNSQLIVQSIWYCIERFEHIKKIRKREKELQLKNKQLEEANITKNLLISIISHDLRGPVNSIVSLLDVLNSEFENITAANKQKYIRSILKSAQNTQHLMENLLEWAKSQSDRSRFSRKTINLRFLAKNSLEPLSAAAREKEIHVEINVPENIRIYADKEMITTVFRNLLSNAVKFTPKKGDINISADKLSNNKTRIFIEDSGIGIEKENLNNIFNIRKAISTPGTNNEPGTGFGLILCKEFVEKNNGKINIESEPEIGTKISLTLPSAPVLE